MFFHSDPSGVPMGIGSHSLPQQRHLALVGGAVKHLGSAAVDGPLWIFCALTLFHSPLLPNAQRNLVCVRRLRELRQPRQCTGSYPSHERLSDRNEEVESSAKETEGRQSPLLTQPTFSIHCSSTGTSAPVHTCLLYAENERQLENLWSAALI